MKARHPRLTRCARETDGATTYNSKCVSVFMEEMGRVTGIRVCSHTHNEPGHGSDQCDSCGANCVRACYAWHIKNGIPIDHARQTVHALQSSAGLKGMIHLLMCHDPCEKLDPSMIPDLRLGTRHCLHKVYQYLDETAALVQYRFFDIGDGLSSSADFLKKARCGHTYGNKKATPISDVRNCDSNTALRTGHREQVTLKFLRRVGCQGPTTYVNGRLTVRYTHNTTTTTISSHLVNSSPSPIIVNPPSPIIPQNQVGDNVDTQRNGKDTWYGGYITSINADGDCDLQYADGEVELAVPRDCIRAQTFVIGDVVEVNCGDKGVWHSAEVLRTNCGVSEHAYDVKYGSKNTFAKGVTHENTKDRLHKKSEELRFRVESKRRRESERAEPQFRRPCIRDNPRPNSKLTKGQAMEQLRKTLQHFSTSFLMSEEKFKLKFVEGVNQLTFVDDDRFNPENLIYNQLETAPHYCLRDLGCLGSRTPVNNTTLQASVW